MDELNKSRIVWVDIVKAFAIFSMVLGHVGVNENVNIFIHAFHMPIFFIMSGICMNTKTTIPTFITKKFKTLIIPYLVWGVILFCFWNLALLILKRPDEMRSISNLLGSLFWNCANASTFGVIQWFLPCLFIAEIMYRLIIKVSKKNTGKVIWLFFLSIVAFTEAYFFSFRLPLALDCAIMAIVFLGLGEIICPYMDTIREWITKKPWMSLIIVFSVAIISLPLIYINGLVNIRTITYNNYFLFFINALIWSVVVIVLSMFIEIKCGKSKIVKFLVWIGKNTLVILLLNSTFIRIYEVIVGDIFITFGGWFTYAINIIIALIITILCTLVSEFINFYCPFLVGKKIKRRKRDNASGNTDVS